MSLAIPVIYYHSIGDHKQIRPKSFLTLPQHIFERQIHILQAYDLETVFLQDVYDYVAGNRTPTRPEIALTFDDGFLDNWVIVWPLACKYGFKFTIYVNPEFVDPRDIIRPTLEDVWNGSVQHDELEWWGYLSWSEMRAMEASGLVDIQSHAMTHTWYPTSDKIVDFHHPGDSYQWLIWNAYPDTKPFWHQSFDETAVPYGTPVYAFGKSIPSRRYLPDDKLTHTLVEIVETAGGRAFFDEPQWRSTLVATAADFRNEYGDTGRYETDKEREHRLYDEVVGSKHAIENALNKEVRFICWPGGGEDPLARRIALENGYLATTKGTALNRPGNDPSHTSRVSSWFGNKRYEGAKYRMFRGQIERAQGKRTPSALGTQAVAQTNRVVTAFKRTLHRG
ncbi:MAG: polysaccharide deacetylase family protein [Anaerolineae bacterium]|nr:polysaccharide deacetylase family protein [Anaerolineae bacterium]